VLLLWAIMWRHLFVRTENSEIQRLISVRKDGKYRNLAVNFRPYRRKIAKFNCKFPYLWTENSVYMCINFRPYGRKIAIYYTWFPSLWTENNTNHLRKHCQNWIIFGRFGNFWPSKADFPPQLTRTTALTDKTYASNPFSDTVYFVSRFQHF